MELTLVLPNILVPLVCPMYHFHHSVVKVVFAWVIVSINVNFLAIHSFASQRIGIKKSYFKLNCNFLLKKNMNSIIFYELSKLDRF